MSGLTMTFDIATMTPEEVSERTMKQQWLSRDTAARLSGLDRFAGGLEEEEAAAESAESAESAQADTAEEQKRLPPRRQLDTGRSSATREPLSSPLSLLH